MPARSPPHRPSRKNCFCAARSSVRPVRKPANWSSDRDQRRRHLLPRDRQRVHAGPGGRRGREKAGAEVRLRKVRELAPQAAIDANEGWSEHVRDRGRPEATADDLVWADAVLFGTPTRFGNAAAQLKQFLDTPAPLWARASWPTRSHRLHRHRHPHGGQETTLLALNNDLLPLGRHHRAARLHRPDPVRANGNPYGTSHDSHDAAPPGEVDLDAAPSRPAASSRPPRHSRSASRPSDPRRHERGNSRDLARIPRACSGRTPTIPVGDTEMTRAFRSRGIAFPRCRNRSADGRSTTQRSAMTRESGKRDGEDNCRRGRHRRPGGRDRAAPQGHQVPVLEGRGDFAESAPESSWAQRVPGARPARRRGFGPGTRGVHRRAVPHGRDHRRRVAGMPLTEAYRRRFGNPYACEPVRPVPAAARGLPGVDRVRLRSRAETWWGTSRPRGRTRRSRPRRARARRGPRRCGRAPLRRPAAARR